MAKIGHYDIGDRWQPQATFTVAGTNTDPTNLIVRQQEPDGTETILLNSSNPAGLGTSGTPVARVSAGVYKLNPGIALDEAGYWFVRFEGTGTAEAAEEHQAIVDPSEFYAAATLGTRALVSLAETKDWLQHMNIATGEDLELARVINDISQRIHDEAGREFKVNGTNPQTRTFEITERTVAGGGRPWYINGDFRGWTSSRARTLWVGDLTSYTQVQILDRDWTTILETVALADITALPITRESWEPIRELEFQDDVTTLYPGMRIAVTGNWGFPSIPGTLRQAVLDAVAQIMDRNVEHYSQDLAPVQAGEGTNVIIVGGASPRFLSLPPSAMAVALDYRDTRFG